MTVDEAIHFAGIWQESASHTTDPTELEKAANVFSFALWYLALEREAANDMLAQAGFGNGPLNQRVAEAIAAALGRRS